MPRIIKNYIAPIFLNMNVDSDFLLNIEFVEFIGKMKAHNSDPALFEIEDSWWCYLHLPDSYFYKEIIERSF